MSSMRLNRRTLVAASIALMPTQRLFAQSTPVATPMGETRTIVDYLGREVVVPANPERVITLSLPILEIALSVGIKPVGSAKFATHDGFPEYLGDQTEGIEIIGDSEWDFEKIITLEPDLAIVDYFGDQDAEALGILEKIVPVVTVGEFRENWRKDSADVAEALNKREEFRAIEEAYDARVATMTEALAPDWSGATVAILRFRPDNMRIMKSNSFAATVLADVGLAMPEIESTGTGVSEDLSLEQAKVVDVDALFVVHDSGADAEKTYTVTLSNPVFQSLPVVQERRTYLVDQETWISLRGYGASQVILDDIQLYLVDGEPGLDPAAL